MKKSIFLIVTATSLICGYTSGFAQIMWQLQITVSGTPPLTSVSTASRDVTWIIDYTQKYVYRTTNGGKNWYKTAALITTDQPVTIEALNSTTAYIGTESKVAKNAGLYRTVDGGQNWQLVYLPTGNSNKFWNWIHFFDANNGIALCDQGTNPEEHFLIVKTTNGGETWTPITNQPASSGSEYGMVNAVYFYDNLNGWFGTCYSGRVFRTTDGGNTWNGFNSGSTSSTAMQPGVRFISPLIGIRTSVESPYLTRSTDGGQTWTPVSNLPVININWMGPAISVSSPSINQLWVGGVAGTSQTPFILTSIDDGVAWQKQTIPDILAGSYVHSMSAVRFGTLNDSVQAFGVTGIATSTGAGQILNYRRPIGLVTAVNDERPNLPSAHTLLQSHPNPFSQQTTIEFVLAATDNVTLIIYNSLGQEIEKLVRAEMPQGSHKVVWEAKDHASGLYYYSLTTKYFSQVRKMILK